MRLYFLVERDIFKKKYIDWKNQILCKLQFSEHFAQLDHHLMFLIFLSGEKTFDFRKIHLATVTECWNTTSTNKKFSPSTGTFVFMSSKSDVTIAWNILSQFQVHHHNPQGKHTQTGFKWVVQNLPQDINFSQPVSF